MGQHLPQGLGGCLALFGGLGEGLGVDLAARQLVAGEGQGAALVLQQDHALAVDQGGLAPVGLIGHNLGGVVGIGVGVLEHALLEQLGEGAGDGPVQALVGENQILFPESLGHRMGVVIAVGGPLIGLQAVGVVEQAADQVHTRLGDGEADPLGHIQGLDAPLHVVGDAGVRVDVALKAHLAPQDAVDEQLVVGESVGVHPQGVALIVGLGCALGGRRLGVVGHDGGGVILDGGAEGGNVVFLEGALGGVDVPLAGGIVGVKAVFTGAAAGEVLDGHGHALFGDAVGAALDAGDQVLEDLLDQSGVLAEGAEGPLPAGIADAVGHVHIAFPQAAGRPLAADAVGKLVDDVHGAVLAPDSGGDAQGAGPGGKDAGGIVHAEDHFAVLIAGVGHHLHRDEVVALLGHGVELVEPVGHVGRGGVGPEDQVAVEPVLQQGGGAGQVLLAEDGLAVELAVIQHARLVGHHGVVGAGGGALGAHPPVRDEQLGDLLFHRQGLDIGGGPLGGGQAPVVDGGDFAGAVNVLEGEAILFDDPAGNGADGGAVGIVIIFQVVGCFFGHEAFLLHQSRNTQVNRRKTGGRTVGDTPQ